MTTNNIKHQKALEQYLGVKKNTGNYEKKLWNKVNKYQKIFSYIPGILCVCVGNSLAMNACHKDSDIDLFIITKNNRVWSTRIYMTLFLTLIRQRKTARKHAGRFCLSFFITEKAINLENIAIKNDIYLAYWVKTLVPIVNENNTFERFQTTNSQTPLSIPPYQGQNLGDFPVQKNTYFHQFLTGLGDVCEKVFKTIFLPRTKKSFQKLGKPFGVIISDDMLKFHDRDKRKEIRDHII